MPTTGDTQLPDVGSVNYNGIQFSALYHSKVVGAVVKDDADRTTKVMEWTLLMEGVVTLHDGEDNTDNTWQSIRQQLSVTGAALVYVGNGFGGLNVNVPGGNVWDVNWGPKPSVINFQPLGQGRSAFITWQVVVRIPELGYLGFSVANPGHDAPVLQFNYEAGITYNEDGYSSLYANGTLEVPKTWPDLTSRQLQSTVDDFREKWLNIQFDLLNFRVTRREFKFSRDKRICSWDFVAEELPPGGLPQGCLEARGNMTVRPLRKFLYMPKACQWEATLRCTYTLRGDWPRRYAAINFFSLLWFRMQSSANGVLAGMGDGNNVRQQPNETFNPGIFALGASLVTGPSGIGALLGPPINAAFTELAKEKTAQLNVTPKQSLYKTSYLSNFSFNEGIYLDGKSISFEASWIFACNFNYIFRASGTWRFPGTTQGGNVWAQSVRNVLGWQSWLKDRLDPNADFIVDLGGGAPPPVPIFKPEQNRTLEGNPNQQNPTPRQFVAN